MLLSFIAYLATLFVFVGLDMVWLTWVGGPAYRAALGDVLLEEARLGPAIAFYLIYPAGLSMFAAVPFIGGASFWQAVLRGAAFGFFTYATYDLSNLATLRNWTVGVTAMDIGWGCVLGAVAAGSAVQVASLIGAHFNLPAA